MKRIDQSTCQVIENVMYPYESVYGQLSAFDNATVLLAQAKTGDSQYPLHDLQIPLHDLQIPLYDLQISLYDLRIVTHYK